MMKEKTLEKNNQMDLGGTNYKQELKRNLKLFSSFAVAFSFISITTGIFTNYQFLITTSGPAGIWSWIITFGGQLLVALIFAELAGAIPVSGYSYQWIKRLSDEKISWITGWICLCYLVLVVPAIDSGLAPIIASLLGIEPSPAEITEIVVFIVLIQGVLNIIGVKLATLINNAAVFTESIGIIVLTVILFGVSLKNGNNPAILLQTGGTGEGLSYIKPFMMSMLLGAFTLIGFEAAANLAEETVDPRKNVPKAVISSLVISGIIGLIFLISITFAIKDIPEIAQVASPISYIIEGSLGIVVGKVFLMIVSISIFACGTVAMTSGSRLVYVMARDNAIFFSDSLKKVSAKTSSPVYATILMVTFGILGAIGSGSLTTLVGVTSIFPALIYLITIICYGMNRKKIKIDKENFSLGKAAKPVFVAAVIWLIFELGILTIPQDFHGAAIAGLVLIGIGVILYYGVFRRRICGEDESTKEEKLPILEPIEMTKTI